MSVSVENFDSDSASVLYEDNHVIAVYKPPGLLTQGDKSGALTLMDWTKGWLRERHQKPGNIFLGLVHRLDKPVAGVVLFGKTSKGASRLSEQFRARTVEKVYWAWVEGGVPVPEGHLTHHIEETDEGRVLVHATASRLSKMAKLSYRLLKQTGSFSQVEIHLETGRRHQIRAQFAAIGCPVIGDKKYGSSTTFRAGAIALFSKKMVFSQTTRAEEFITVEIPEGICALQANR